MSMPANQARIYQILLNKFNLKVSESLFVDDKLENILAAQKLGFRTILFDESVDLGQKLINLWSKINLKNVRFEMLDCKKSSDISNDLPTILFCIHGFYICQKSGNSSSSSF